MTRSDLLVLVLTRRCDRRCGFCPQEFEDRDMPAAVLDAALARFLPRLAGRGRVKLFGGEPLLRPDLVARALDAVARVAPRATVELSTNGDALAAGPGTLAGRANLEVFASRPVRGAALLPRAALNVLLAPGETPRQTAARVVRGRAAGFARLNFLPAYFTPWSAVELEGLRRRFAAALLALRKLAERGLPAEVVNLSRTSTTPLYNDGLVVDVDGEVYASNLMLVRAAAGRRGDLRLGRVDGPLARAPRRSALEVLDECVPPDALAATRRADALLSEFCRALAAEPGARERRDEALRR